MAQQLLVERGDKSVVPALRKLASRARPTCARGLQALWTLDGLDAIEPADVMPALAHANSDVRVSALRLAERWLGAAETSDAGRGAEAAGRYRLGGAAPVGRDAWRAAGAGSKEAALATRARAARRRSDRRGCRDQRAARQRAGGARPAAAGDGRDAAAVGCDHHAGGDDRARGRRSNAPVREADLRAARSAETTRVRPGSGRRCCAAPKSRCSPRRCRVPRAVAPGIRMRRVETCPGGRGGPRGRARFPARSRVRIRPRRLRAQVDRVCHARRASLRSSRVAAQAASSATRCQRCSARIGWPGKPAWRPLRHR